MRRISVFGYVEWCLGPPRTGERRFVVTEIRCGEWRVVGAEHIQPGVRGPSGVLPRHGPARSSTCDRTEFIGRNSLLARPAALARAALQGAPAPAWTRAGRCRSCLEIPAGESRQVAFVLGEGADAARGRELGDTVRDNSTKCWRQSPDRTVLGRHPRRRPGPHARRLVRSAREPMAAVPDPQLPHLGAQRALSARRRIRLPRSAAGRAGAAPRAPGSVPRAPAAGGVPAVRGGRRPALVASADRARDTHALLGRSALAAVRRCRVRRAHRRRLGARRGGRRSSRARRSSRGSTRRTSCRRVSGDRRRCSSTRAAPSSAR